MIAPRNLFRLLSIHRVLMHHGLDEFVSAVHLYRPLRWLLFFDPANWFNRRKQGPRGERLRLALESLGPIFVKFGQALSTRRDLLPRDIADELAKLQDRVPPFPGDVAIQIVEEAFGKPVTELFSRFDDEPLAAASIAQVHKATLNDGSDVVVKILRPGMQKAIQRDIDVLFDLARLAQKYWKESRRLRPVEVVEEYEKTVLDELDLLREAANASQLRRNFEDSDLLHVPEIHWDYCRLNVMVMERISGIPIAQVDKLHEMNTNMQRLAENGVEIFFKQVFRHNFFHADMHPGNIFVDTTDPEHPKYIAVDFGIVGSLSERDQHYLAENFLAFFERDYYRVAKLHVDSGWVPADTRVEDLESAIRTVCEPIFDRPLKDISFGQVLVHLFRTARRFNMEVQPQLVLLQKTLLNIEGLGRQLYPELDLWSTAHPIMRQWMRDRVSPQAILRHFGEKLPELSDIIRQLPDVAHRLLQEIADGDFKIRVENNGIDEIRDQLRRSDRRRFYLISGAASLLSGAVLVGLDVQPPVLGWIVAIAGAILMVRGRP